MKYHSNFRHAAFTLVELLVVMSIISVLLVVTVPVVSDMLKSQSITKAINDIDALLELARNEAMTSQSYVYVGFANTDKADGTSELQGLIITCMGGKPGTYTSGSKGYISKTRQLTQLYKWENIKMVALDELGENIRSLRIGSQSTSPVVNQPMLDFSIGAGTKTDPKAAYRTVLFTPQGYAIFQQLKSGTNGRTSPGAVTVNTPFVKFLDIGLLPTVYGSRMDQESNAAAIVMNGISGQTQILRL